MTRIRRLFLCFLCLGLLLGLNPYPLVASAQEGGNNSHLLTQGDTVNTDWEINQIIPETFELAGENADFQIYANRATLAFKVKDKRSGYIWHSNLDEKGEGDRLNKTWVAFAQSGISIDYLDEKAAPKRASVTNSNPIIDFKMIDEGFQASVTFTEPSISMDVIVKLEPAGVSVDIPFASIKEADSKFKLGVLYVYPFFGATRGGSVPGYMFIPDGSGTLIRFSETTKAKNMFYGRYYGDDLGMTTMIPFDPTVNRAYRISIPVIGMVHGYKQNAYIAVVEKGASYGEVQAHPSGVTTNFNFVHNAFIYNESYFQATNRSGAGVTTLQRNTNAFDVRIHYRFLTGEGSDYVGMARSYQQYLIETGRLHSVSDPDEDIGIRLEFLAGDKEKILLWNRFVPMTTVEQMVSILNDLAISNVDVVYYGWQPLGASSMPPKAFKLDQRLGSTGELRSLVEKVEAGGGKLYLYLDPQAALFEESGYSPRNDLAMSITSSNLQGYNRMKSNFYLNYDALGNHFLSLNADIGETLGAGLALDGIGYMLYSDFKENHFLNREEAIQKYQSLLDASQVSYSFYMPDDYMFGKMQAYYDIPLSTSGYIYTTDVVPFLQVVLAGYIPTYGPALNFSSNLQDDLLRHLDFGVYPSYFLTQDVTAKILNTMSNWIYTSSYPQWGQDIKTTYQRLNDLLGQVKGQSIVARDVLVPGVVATSYSNGKKIIVNYNTQLYSNRDVEVNGKDAVITEVMP
ncbi:MAG TPA: DUF5696 domain-containing protein [Bellilinea sp.]|nr:DUF5696 domain-containing protein [Bellilinea sp.]